MPKIGEVWVKSILGAAWQSLLGSVCHAQVRHFCNARLGLSERAMQTVTWPEVARRIVEVRSRHSDQQRIYRVFVRAGLVDLPVACTQTDCVLSPPTCRCSATCGCASSAT